MKQILGVVKNKDGKSFWTKIGVAFENKDGSMNLKFDFLPTNAETTIQLREMKSKEQKEAPAATESEPRITDSETPF